MCVGCGRRASKRDLVRYSAVEGVLVPGRVDGRGAYTCMTYACFDRAVKRAAFARRLRTIVAIPESLRQSGGAA